MTATPVFTCSICGEGSTRICARCTKDACDNHLCEKCFCCSDCCECEQVLAEAPRTQVRTVVEPHVEPQPHAEPEPPPVASYGPVPSPVPETNAEPESPVEADQPPPTDLT